MEIKESIAYLRPIADSAHLKQYSAALDTAIRCMEEVGELKLWQNNGRASGCGAERR